MPKKNIIIVGAGGFAYECYLYVSDRIKQGDNITFKGFAAAEITSVAGYGLSNLVIGTDDDVEFKHNDEVVIAIGTPTVRKLVFEKLEKRGAKFYNLLAPTARVLPEILKSSCGGIFCPYTNVISSKFGDGNVVNTFSTIAHDTVVGNFNVLSAYCDITGNAKMGNLNFFGSHAVMLPKSKIGNENKIAASSVVYKGCKNNCVMLGNPANKVGSTGGE